jgi:hypothetical protein
MKRARTWCELYSFPGFRAAAKLKGVFGDPDVRVATLRRKKRPAPVRAVAARAVRSTTGGWRGHETWVRVDFALSLNSSGCA